MNKKAMLIGGVIGLLIVMVFAIPQQVLNNDDCIDTCSEYNHLMFEYEKDCNFILDIGKQRCSYVNQSKLYDYCFEVCNYEEVN